MPRHPGGRPRFVPSEMQRTLVSVLAAHGVSQRVIAKRIFHPRDLDERGRPLDGAQPIEADTLRRAFRAELDEGREAVRIAMIQAIVRAANAGSWGAARYWLMTHGGPEWRLTNRLALSGDVALRREFGAMSTAEIDAALDALDAEDEVEARFGSEVP